MAQSNALLPLDKSCVEIQKDRFAKSFAILYKFYRKRARLHKLFTNLTHSLQRFFYKIQTHKRLQ